MRLIPGLPAFWVKAIKISLFKNILFIVNVIFAKQNKQKSE